MSETPRVDFLDFHDQEMFADGTGYGKLWQLARTLELELSAAQQGLKAMEQMNGDLLDELSAARRDAERMDLLAELINVSAVIEMGGRPALDKVSWSERLNTLIFKQYEFYRRSHDTPKAFRLAVDELATWLVRYQRVINSTEDANRVIDYILKWNRGDDMKDVIGAQISRKPTQQDEMPELPTREQIHGGIYIAARYYDALRAHCERLVKEKRVYQHIAGGALHGTDHADRLAATHKNSPIDAHNAAYELWRKNQDETIEAIIKPLRERAESAESRLAALREEVIEEMMKVCAEKSLAYHNAGDIPRANAAWECKRALAQRGKG